MDTIQFVYSRFLSHLEKSRDVFISRSNVGPLNVHRSVMYQRSLDEERNLFEGHLA
jgi:hypothetical protein